MKLFIIFGCLLASSPVFAQKEDHLYKIPDSVLNKLNRTSIKAEIMDFYSTRPKENQAGSISSGYGAIHILPQDNMPCVVPDMNQFTVMPNPGSGLLQLPPIDPGIYRGKNNKAGKK